MPCDATGMFKLCELIQGTQHSILFHFEGPHGPANKPTNHLELVTLLLQPPDPQGLGAKA